MSGTGGRPPRVDPPRKGLRGSRAHVAWDPFGEHELVVVVLGYSRALWAQWVERDAPTAVLARCLLHAAHCFGGSPRWWTFEEPDCRVLQWDGTSERFAAPFEALAWHLGSGLGVWRGGSRGPAVAAFDDLRWAPVWPGRQGLSRSNRALGAWLVERASRKPHPGQPSRSVAEVFAEERGHLHPLPATWDTLDARLAGAKDDRAFDD